MTKANCTTQEIKRQRKKNTLGYAYSSTRYIELATKAHGGEYTYEKVRYVNAKTKIVVTCRVHGDFDISPSYHLNSGGRCGKCFPRVGNRKPATNEQFIAKARKKHGNRFDYAKTIYKHSQKEVTITCLEHGDFTQAASTHLRSKHGCPQCAKDSGARNLTKNTEWFIDESRKKFGGKYDYSETKYTGSTSPLIIICPEHGDFERTAASHLHGYGCNRCAGVKDRMKTTADFIERAVSVHGDTYSYFGTEYKDWSTKVSVGCKEHGIFEQSVSEHLKGAGCRACAMARVGGWSRSDFRRMCSKNKSGNATLYVIKCFDEKEYFYKIGITSNDLQTRFGNTRSMPYDYTTEHKIEGEAGYIYDLEVKLHLLLKNKSYEPSIEFRGYTECFTTIKPITRLLKELSNTDQLQLIA